MNIKRVNNNHAFGGKFIINNIKSNKITELITSEKVDKELNDIFLGKHLSDRMCVIRTQDECLERLKSFVNTIGQTIGEKFDKNLQYPQAKEMSAIYSTTKNKNHLDVPEFFSILHTIN